MISYFLDPFTATHKETGHELLVLGLHVLGLHVDALGHIERRLRLVAICITDEGDLVEYAASQLNMNIRYDDRKHEWVDTVLPAEPEGDDDGA